MSSLAVEATPISAVRIITPKRHGDSRGFFSEVYNRRDFAEAGIALDFVQDNHSRSEQVGTLRGLHCQSEPFAQDKLIRVVRGRILDFAVDIRRSSPTYKRHVAVELSAENWRQLLVPKGFLHGFVTLEPWTEVVYKVTNVHSPAHDFGVIWNDPDLALPWPEIPGGPILSAKDAQLPRLVGAPLPFD